MAEFLIYGGLAGLGALLYMSAKMPYITSKLKNVLPLSWMFGGLQADRYRQQLYSPSADYIFHPDYINNDVARVPEVRDRGVYGIPRSNIQIMPGGNVIQLHRRANLSL